MSRSRKMDEEAEQVTPEEYKKYSSPMIYKLPPDEAYRRALADYLDHVPVHMLASTYGIPQKQLTTWINDGNGTDKSWAELREEADNSIRQDYFVTKSYRMHELVSLNMIALRRLLTKLVKKKNMTVRDGKMLAETLELLDKITRLDEGRSTSNVAVLHKPATLEEVRAELQKIDPFLSKQKQQLESSNGKALEIGSSNTIVTADELPATVHRNNKKPK